MGCKKDEKNTGLNINESGNIVELNKSEYSTDSYEASVVFDGDHYALNIFTNLIDGPVKFTYDTEEFLFDDETPFLRENSSYIENETKRTYTIYLESNKLYTFNFVKLKDKDLVINKSLNFE